MDDVSGRYNKLASCFVFILILLIGVGILKMNVNWIFNLFGILTILYMLFIISDIIFFEKYIFNENYFKKYWNILGYKLAYKIHYENLVFAGLNKISFFFVIIGFRNSKSKLSVLFLSLYSIGNCNEDFKKIKDFLIHKKIIKGDEYAWNC